MDNKILYSSFLPLLAVGTLSATESDELITVTASRLALPITATLNDVIVIDAQEIAATSSVTLFELLQAKSGLDWVRKGGPGQEISMYVRGSNVNQLLVLLDGIEIGSATLGYKALADINLAQVERIEIVKGPRAAIWGSKAIGGVLQIFSKDSQSTQLSLGAGSFNERNISLASGVNNDAFSASFSFDSLRSDGIDARFDGDPDKDGIERDNLKLMARYQASNQQALTFRYMGTEGETQYDSFFGDDTLVVDNDLLSINYRLEQSNHSHQFQAGRQTDSSSTLDDGATLFVFETVSDSLKYLFDVKQTEQWTIGASVEYLNEDVSNSSTEYNNDERKTQSGHLYSHYQTEVWINELAVRHTDVDGLASNTSVHAGLGLRPANGHLISFNYGEGFKVPTFNDLYFPFGGNPNLDYELSENLELVYKHWSDVGNLSLSIFDNDIRNLIQFTPDENGVFTANNVGSVNLQGADLTYIWQTGEINHQITAQYVDAKDTTTNQPLQLRAKNQLGYQLSGTIDSGLDYQVSLQHIGERPDFDYQTFAPIELDAFTQVNLNLSYTINDNWLVRLAARDLFDEEGIYVSGYRAAGRTFRLSFTYQAD